MNIIETVKQILTECPKMSEFCNGLSYDFTENTPGNFGLYSTGDTLVKTDILGNQKRKHSFVLYANNQSFTDFERLANSTFLLELSYWLENVKGVDLTVSDGSAEHPGKLLGLTSANGMLYNIPTGDINDGVTYQLQIYADYSVERQ